MNDTKVKQSIRQVGSNNWFLFRECCKAAPLYMFFVCFEAIRLRAFIFLEHIILIGYVLEAAELGYPFKKVAMAVIGVFILLCIVMIYSGLVDNRIARKGKNRINERIKLMLYEKAKSIDLSQYDDPEFYNEFVLTMSEAENQIERMIQFVAKIFEGITTCVCSTGLFLVKDKTVIIFVLISFLGGFYFNLKANKLGFKLRIARTVHEKRLAYVNRVFYLNDYAKEHRLNPEMSDKMYEWFEESADAMGDIYRKHGKLNFFYHYMQKFVFNETLCDFGIAIYLVYQAAVQHSISFSAVAVLFNASMGLRGGLHQVTGIYPDACENSLYIQKIRNFLAIEPKIVNEKGIPMPKVPKTIEFRDVSFAYQSSEQYVLRHLNLKIHPREKIALVGYNGAGKTTLIKLLMRLYDVTEGEILYDGVNIKEYDLNEYREQIGTVFQDYVLFGATLKENVLMEEAVTADDGKVRKALEESGFKKRLEQLPNGLQTELTTEFAEDGVNLSGGESQKVAISRVFYRSASLMILDEPSSALDPIAEYQLNHSMMKAADRKTVIFISHRLSTTRLADKIILLEHGRIVEEGSHEELLQQGGTYAQMWRVQAGQYIEV